MGNFYGLFLIVDFVTVLKYLQCFRTSSLTLLELEEKGNTCSDSLIRERGCSRHCCSLDTGWSIPSHLLALSLRMAFTSAKYMHHFSCSLFSSRYLWGGIRHFLWTRWWRGRVTAQGRFGKLDACLNCHTVKDFCHNKAFSIQQRVYG